MTRERDGVTTGAGGLIIFNLLAMQQVIASDPIWLFSWHTFCSKNIPIYLY
ncbi:MAG: hypothetical protein LWX02_09740 [Deltaproteobacteria bacterium]|nr:hypothetical protein [Deltaproteobacteria bacterium]MDL1988164.1 hypothetical protein [Deltaproteobacteria bacterium]